MDGYCPCMGPRAPPGHSLTNRLFTRNDEYVSMRSHLVKRMTIAERESRRSYLPPISSLMNPLIIHRSPPHFNFYKVAQETSYTPHSSGEFRPEVSTISKIDHVVNIAINNNNNTIMAAKSHLVSKVPQLKDQSTKKRVEKVVEKNKKMRANGRIPDMAAFFVKILKSRSTQHLCQWTTNQSEFKIVDIKALRLRYMEEYKRAKVMTHDHFIRRIRSSHRLKIINENDDIYAFIPIVSLDDNGRLKEHNVIQSPMSTDTQLINDELSRDTVTTSTTVSDIDEATREDIDRLISSSLIVPKANHMTDHDLYCKDPLELSIDRLNRDNQSIDQTDISFIDEYYAEIHATL